MSSANIDSVDLHELSVSSFVPDSQYVFLTFTEESMRGAGRDYFTAYPGNMCEPHVEVLTYQPVSVLSATEARLVNQEGEEYLLEGCHAISLDDPSKKMILASRWPYLWLGVALGTDHLERTVKTVLETIEEQGFQIRHIEGRWYGQGLNMKYAPPTIEIAKKLLSQAA